MLDNVNQFELGSSNSEWVCEGITKRDNSGLFYLRICPHQTVSSLKLW